jgi:hypothetical protein
MTAPTTRSSPSTTPPRNLRPSSLHQASAAVSTGWISPEAATIVRRMKEDEFIESNLKLS